MADKVQSTSKASRDAMQANTRPATKAETIIIRSVVGLLGSLGAGVAGTLFFYALMLLIEGYTYIPTALVFLAFATASAYLAFRFIRAGFKNPCIMRIGNHRSTFDDVTTPISIPASAHNEPLTYMDGYLYGIGPYASTHYRNNNN